MGMFKADGRAEAAKPKTVSASITIKTEDIKKEDGRLKPADQAEIAESKGKKFKCPRCKAVRIFKTIEFLPIDLGTHLIDKLKF